MIRATVDDTGVKLMLSHAVDEAGRACEISIDKTAKDIKKAVYNVMKMVFDSPTRYTLNSLKVTPTRNHNMKAFVWFKEPERMRKHYLVPQVEGGKREYKGFERALGKIKMVPGHGARMTKAGNVSPGQIRQVLSVLGRAELTAGYSANITDRSKGRNLKKRDYVYLPRGSARGYLPPGVYERVAQKRRGIGAKQKKTIRKFGEFQKGKTRRRFSSVIMARGLRGILIKGRQHKPVKPLLPFYQTAAITYRKRFMVHYRRELLRRF